MEQRLNFHLSDSCLNFLFDLSELKAAVMQL